VSGIALGKATRPLGPSTGGCNVAQDPSLDARTARPAWIPQPFTQLKLAADDPLEVSVTFSLWRVPGRKTLLHDGSGMVLTARINGDTLRLTLDAGVEDDRPFAFLLSARADMRASWRTVSALIALFNSTQASRAGAKQRPNRQLMLHMRALQALDGEAAGASHREIAEVIFGAQDVFERWATNSELRAQIRYLLRRGHHMVSSGYRQLPSKSRPAH